MYNDMGLTGITYLCRRRQFATHIVMILNILHIKHNDGDTQNQIIKGRSTLYVTTTTHSSNITINNGTLVQIILKTVKTGKSETAICMIYSCCAVC